MKKYMKVFFLLYLGGFAAGIFCANLLQREAGYQTSLLPVYLSAAQTGYPDKENLFGQLLIKRGSFLAVGTLCGLTPLGVPFILVSLIWFGFLAGNLITLFLLEYGLRGLGIGTICFWPQAFFYVPGWLFFFFVMMQMSQKCWGQKKREKADYKACLFFVSGAAVFILLGIWMESYVNQNLLGYILSKWI